MENPVVNKNENSKIDERKFDGRANFKVDDNVETLLDAHFEKYDIKKQEVCKNFQIYTRRIFLKKFLACFMLIYVVDNVSYFFQI